MPKLFKEFLDGNLSVGFIQMTTDLDLVVREVYELMEENRDERFHLDVVKIK